ncbi:MAG: 2-succinyl-5-enolpyruvyl-6-hydroxy-3-cyclohexene-1-carboxylic-acid synthase [Candidatus Zixiibacteriota bacterium]|nr:MAG: 2-succinyl-5-enolpyruvyl-6-hydroxy-3-cyclohexene-1-carboxylic-acid synthase [candidate division Zixibacteria bacterium]
MDTAGINTLWGNLIIEELIRNGVSYFVISPGSRSTPLTVAAAKNDRAHTLVHFDERGAAFHALGYARATGRPAALICTSGTAAANYLPAIVEASQDSLPLIVLTADRPPELQDTGANQTIKQTGLYGVFVRGQFDLPCPDEKIDPRALLTTIDQAVYHSLRSPSGPVHLNCMFREPLGPPEKVPDLSAPKEMRHWSESSSPYTNYPIPHIAATDESIAEIVTTLNTTDRGILVVGRLDSDAQRKAVLEFSRKLGWPTLPDVTSGLRSVSDEQITHYYDLALHSDKFAESVRPSVVLHLGRQFVSKRLLQFIKSAEPSDYIVVNDSPDRLDPTHRVTRKIECDLVTFCHKASADLCTPDCLSFANKWKQATDAVDTLLEGFQGSGTAPPGAEIARCLVQKLPQEYALFSASSMAIRELDKYSPKNRSIMHVAANRGASGIDGTIASATGYAAGPGQPVVALVGDLAALHDLNSLALLRNADPPVVVVIMNNNGGGIFEFLPIEKTGDICKEFFVAPHGMTFQNAAQMFDLSYFPVEPTNGSYVEPFGSTLAKATGSRSSSIIEITIDRQTNLQRYSEMILNIHKAIEEA